MFFYDAGNNIYNNIKIYIARRYNTYTFFIENSDGERLTIFFRNLD